MQWVATRLSRFGFKCIMNKHDFCEQSSCKCLCHSTNSKKNIARKKLATK
jgi:hypothetical protein